MGTAFRELRHENKVLKEQFVFASVQARRAANRRTFWKLISYSFALGMVVGATMTLVLIFAVK